MTGASGDIERAIQRANAERRLSVASRRIMVARVFIPLTVVYCSLVAMKDPATPFRSLSFLAIATALTLGYCFFALHAVKDRAYRPVLGAVLDVGLIVFFAVPVLTRFANQGVQAPYTLISVLLAMPCLGYSFAMRPGGERHAGWVSSSLGLGIIHLSVPDSFPPELFYSGAAQYAIVCTLYFLMFCFGEKHSQYVHHLVTFAASRQVWRDRLASFLPPRAIERLEREGGVQMGGETSDAAVLFADIRGFTRLAESMPPPKVLQMLNEYFSGMVAVVFAHGGTIDKFMGDGLLAVFSDRTGSSNLASAALAAAKAMQKEIHEMNERRVRNGDPPFHVGIGIHYGPVIAGWLGSELKPEYTVIGDTVNLASRVEGLTKRFGVEILLTEAVVSAIASTDGFVSMGTHRVRGREEPMALYVPAEHAFAVAPERPRVLRIAPSGARNRSSARIGAGPFRRAA